MNFLLAGQIIAIFYVPVLVIAYTIYILYVIAMEGTVEGFCFLIAYVLFFYRALKYRFMKWMDRLEERKAKKGLPDREQPSGWPARTGRILLAGYLGLSHIVISLILILGIGFAMPFGYFYYKTYTNKTIKTVQEASSIVFSKDGLWSAQVFLRLKDRGHWYFTVNGSPRRTAYSEIEIVFPDQRRIRERLSPTVEWSQKQDVMTPYTLNWNKDGKILTCLSSTGISYQCYVMADHVQVTKSKSVLELMDAEPLSLTVLKQLRRAGIPETTTSRLQMIKIEQQHNKRDRKEFYCEDPSILLVIGPEFGTYRRYYSFGPILFFGKDADPGYAISDQWIFLDGDVIPWDGKVIAPTIYATRTHTSKNDKVEGRVVIVPD